MKYFPLSEDITEILIKKTQSQDPHFFRILVAYYMAKVASMMRCNVKTHDRGLVPVGLYVLNLAQSGFGKNFATNIMEDQIIGAFRTAFLNNTFDTVAEQNMLKMATAKAATDPNGDPEGQLKALHREFELLGPLAFSFDSGTVPALKQMRQKLLLANAGAICFEGDEVGSNFINNADLLNSFLELYDIGKTKIKLIKNTADSQRSEEIEGRTPTNLLLFGTPNKLLNGKVEAEFDQMLETGYARRFLFGYSQLNSTNHQLTADELYDSLINSNIDDDIIKLETHFQKLAVPSMAHRNLTMTKQVSLRILKYKLECEKTAAEFKEHQEVHKAEMTHRYYKVIKLAGAYAFCDGATQLDEKYVEYAINLVEDSGEAFQRIMMRDRNYIRVAKYLADMNQEMTHVDIMEDVPAYRGSEAQRREIINLATAWGYKNNIILRRRIQDGVEFIHGEALQETDLNEIQVAYSTDIVKGYKKEIVPFDKLHKMTTAKNIHYTAHAFESGYRDSEHAIAGFNLAIFDIDSGCTLEAAQALLKDYTHLISTTKRHTETKHRFRILMPLSHFMILTPGKYSQFMQNLFQWMPFEVDIATKDIARKWESCENAQHFYNAGQLLDATEFIPQTKKAENNRKFLDNYSSLDALERWFLKNTEEGNRSNMLIKYAYALVDNGYDSTSIQQRVLSFNSKLSRPLDEGEILTTIMVSVAKKLGEKTHV